MENKRLDSYQDVAIPDTWGELKKSLVMALEKCKEKYYLGKVQSTATTWEQIPVAQSKLVRYVENILRNTLNALDNTDGGDKELAIYFYDEDNTFAFTIADMAHEFPLQILTNLGQRSNGNGFVEMFEFIAESGASLIITEYKEQGIPRKSLKTIFDGKERIVITSDYRYEELKQAISDSRIEVVEYE